MNKDQIGFFYKASLELLEAESLQDSYKSIVKWAMMLVGAKYGSIFEVRNEIPIRVYTSDPKLYKIIPRKNGGTYYAYKKGPFLRSVTQITPFHPIMKEMKIDSDITVGLKYDKERIGALSVLSYKNHPFTKKDLEVIKLFAPLASHSIKQQKLKEDLRKTISERDLFISMAAHEIRTPLTSIYTFAQYLAKAAVDKDKSNSKYMDKIKFGVGRLEGLINDFLSIQQINSKKMAYNFEKVDLIKAIEGAIDFFSFQFRDHKVNLKFSTKERFFVNADPGKLHQAFLNILKNAGKYSPKNSDISIEVLKENGQILTLITDKGKGILKKDIDHIFEKFYRSDKTQTEGMGLGLFLTKNIIQAHGGEINVDSTRGKGTTFIVKLPINNDQRVSSKPIR